MESTDLKSKGMQWHFFGGMLIEYDSMLLSVYHPGILIPSPIGLKPTSSGTKRDHFHH
jgi:hypothetical protein